MTAPLQETLHEFLDRIWAIHADIGPEMCMPTVVAQNTEGALFVFKMPWTNDAEKICALAMTTLEMLKNGCTRYVFVHEAWMAAYASDDEIETKGMPSQRLDRKEVLIAVAVDRYMDDRHAYAAEIENLPRGKRRLKTRTSFNGSGRLYDLFGSGQAVRSRETH
jgi:hypothetical protein